MTQDTDFSGADRVFEAVRRFHQRFGLPIADRPCQLSPERVSARAKWINDEVTELAAAQSLVDQVDALVDILYLAVGSLVEMGVKPGIPLLYVHQANLAKDSPGGVGKLDAAGKVMKPATWVGPERKIQAYLDQL
jgi:predicted HAD superfamily Cof-like phosphohydrolase